jgi:hypothetical protein
MVIVKRLWMLLAAAGLVVALAGTANAAEPAPASGDGLTASAGLHVAQLCAVTTEDLSTDEVYMSKNGTRAWGPTPMNQGSCTRGIFVNVSYGDVISLYDDDNPDGDDKLGTVTINGVGEYHFSGAGAFYKMWTEN